jgi:hypothetical protein
MNATIGEMAEGQQAVIFSQAFDLHHTHGSL